MQAEYCKHKIRAILTKKTLFTILKYVFGLGFGVLLMWLAMRGIDFEEVKQGFREANYFWVAIGLIVAILSHWFRAMRWKMLISAAGHESNTWNLFCSIMVGYLVNQALPRAGEVTRATLSARTERMPITVSLGTMVTDRVFDVISLGLLVLGVFIFQFKEITAILDKAFANGGTATDPEPGAGLWKWIVIGLMALGLAVFIIFRKKLMKIAIVAKLVNFVVGIWNAVLSVRKMKNPFKFVALSISIWVCYILMTYLVFFALDSTQDLGFGFAITAFTIGGIGMVIPSPGGIGTYHFAIIMSFVAYAASFGWTEDHARIVGTNIAFIIHTSQFIMMIFAGALCYLFLLPKMKIAANEKPEGEEIAENA